jgi:hypothetical protein
MGARETRARQLSSGRHIVVATPVRGARAIREHRRDGSGRATMAHESAAVCVGRGRLPSQWVDFLRKIE